MNKMEIIRGIESTQLKDNIPEIKPGYTVRVHVKVKEYRYNAKKRQWEEKIRIQPFQGIVMRMKGSGINRTITVRRVSHGVGIERIFPIHSPNVEKIEVIKKVKPKRAVLSFIRNLSEKALRRKLKEIRE